MEINLDDYTVNVEQVNMFNFKVEVITKDNNKFSSNIQANPAQLNKESIIRNFLDKNNRNHWALELEIIKIEGENTPKVEEKENKDEIKGEVKEEVILTGEQKQEFINKCNNVPENAPTLFNKDKEIPTVVYES